MLLSASHITFCFTSFRLFVCFLILNNMKSSVHKLHKSYVNVYLLYFENEYLYKKGLGLWRCKTLCFLFLKWLNNLMKRFCWSMTECYYLCTKRYEIQVTFWKQDWGLGPCAVYTFFFSQFVLGKSWIQ